MVGVALGSLGGFFYLIGLRQLVGLSCFGFAFLGTACLCQGVEWLSNYLANTPSSKEEIPNTEILKIMAQLDDECGITDPDSRTVVPIPSNYKVCPICKEQDFWHVFIGSDCCRKCQATHANVVNGLYSYKVEAPREIYETDVPTMATPQVPCSMCAKKFWTVRDMDFHQWTDHRYSMSVKELQKWKKKYPSPFPTSEQERAMVDSLYNKKFS